MAANLEPDILGRWLLAAPLVSQRTTLKQLSDQLNDHQTLLRDGGTDHGEAPVTGLVRVAPRRRGRGPGHRHAPVRQHAGRGDCRRQPPLRRLRPESHGPRGRCPREPPSRISRRCHGGGHFVRLRRVGLRVRVGRPAVAACVGSRAEHVALDAQAVCGWATMYLGPATQMSMPPAPGGRHDLVRAEAGACLKAQRSRLKELCQCRQVRPPAGRQDLQTAGGSHEDARANAPPIVWHGSCSAERLQ